jgi:hypothetical protein
VTQVTPEGGRPGHSAAIDNTPARRPRTRKKAMTIRARLQATTHLAGLLVAAAIILSIPFGAAVALRSGISIFL